MIALSPIGTYFRNGYINRNDDVNVVIYLVS